MQTLDLHGTRHHEVDRLVENFILLNPPPTRIIIGNSPAMQTLVRTVLERYAFHHRVENDWNLGSWIIY